MNLSEISLGELIKEARKIKSKQTKTKYTQELLSKDVGVSKSYIGDIEYGRFIPSYELLIKISKACNVPFSFFAIYDEHILKHLETMYSQSDFNENIEIINFYKNHARVPYDIEYQINGYFNEKKLNNYSKSFDEYCSSTLDRIPQAIYDPNINIKVLKTLNTDYFWGDIPIGNIVYNYDLNPKYTYIALPMPDDGMNLSKITENDLVIIRRQHDIENGDIAAIKLDNNYDMIRKVFKSGTTITLIPNSSDSKYEPISIDSSKIQVVGKVVKVTFNL